MPYSEIPSTFVENLYKGYWIVETLCCSAIAVLAIKRAN